MSFDIIGILSLQTFANIIQIASAVVLAITAILIGFQTREQTRFRKLEAYRHLYETLASEESRSARRIVFERRNDIIDKPYETIHSDNALRSVISRVTSDYDTMGKLVTMKYITPKLAYEMWGGSAYRMYSILQCYLKFDRIKRNEELPWDLKHSKYFEKFALASERWLDKHNERLRNRPPLK